MLERKCKRASDLRPHSASPVNGCFWQISHSGVVKISDLALTKFETSSVPSLSTRLRDDLECDFKVERVSDTLQSLQS
jgi:hypothetical protein